METAQKVIRIKWVHSGIGFDHSQAEFVRSLGLRRLNHVVERPDTPQVRGLVAKVAHLVEIVNDVSEPVWNSTPAYTIKAPPSEPAPASEELDISARAPGEASPAASEPNPVSGGSVPASSSTRAPAPSSEPAIASEGIVSSPNEQSEKE